MYELKLRNFMCFEKRTFLFANKMTLIAAVSGSGKTTIITAIRFALWDNPRERKELRKKEIMHGKSSCSVTLTVTQDNRKFSIQRTKHPNRLVIETTTASGVSQSEDAEAQQVIDSHFGRSSVNLFEMTAAESLDYLERMALGNNIERIEVDTLKTQLKETTSNTSSAIRTNDGKLEVYRKLAQTHKLKITFETPLIEPQRPWEDFQWSPECVETASQTLQREQDLLVALKLQEVECKLKTAEQRTVLSTAERSLALLQDIPAPPERPVCPVNTCSSQLTNELYTTQELLHSILKTAGVREKQALLTSQMEESETKIQRLKSQLVDEEPLKNKIAEAEALNRKQLKIDLSNQRATALREKLKVLSASALETTSTLDENELKTNLYTLQKLQSKIRALDPDKKYTVDQLQTIIEDQKKRINKSLTCPKCFIRLQLTDDATLEIDNRENLANLEQLLNYTTQLAQLKPEQWYRSKLTHLQEMKQLKRELEAEEATLRSLKVEKPISNLTELLTALSLNASTDKQLQEELRTLETTRKGLSELLIGETPIVESRTAEEIEQECDKLKRDISARRTYEELKSKFDKAVEMRLWNETEIVCAEENIARGKEQLHSLQLAEQEINERVKHASIAVEAAKTKLALLKEYCENLERFQRNSDLLAQLQQTQQTVAELEREQETLNERYQAALVIKAKIAEAESIALTTLIDTLNITLQPILEVFFEDPIVVNVSMFKETKNSGIKHRVTINIYYKGIVYDCASLSSGEYARVSLAFSLAMHKLNGTPLTPLLLDERTANLDQDLSTLIYSVVREEVQTAVIVVAHQVITGPFDEVINL